MKSAIIYGSKHGTTKKCAEMIKEKLDGEIVIININENENIDIDNYDLLMIGSSIYIGAINKGIKKFLENNKEKILNKNFGLFMVCMSEDDKVELQFKENINEDILNNAKAKINLGGEFLFNKMNFFERQIVKMVSKADSEKNKINIKENISKIREDRINEFVELMSRR